MPTLSTIGAACARAWGFTSGLVKDQYFNLVSLLLPGNGTNGAQNNTFLDSSGNTFTITRNGNTTQGTFSPFSQTGWGNYFNGSSYLQVASNAAFAFGTGDFSIEFWFYPTVAATQRNISFPTANAPIMNMTSSRTLEFGNYGISTIATTSNTLTLNAWNFCAASRVSGTLRLFINGVEGASVSNSTNFVQSLVNIGTDTGGIFATGYMADVRIVKGSGFTTSTVPIAPLTAISGTSLLTCQSNRFRDASGNGFTITTSGSPSVTPFSPFAPTQSYSASAVGGSGYFDGTGDYLNAVSANTANAMGSGDWTIEAFVYKTNSTEGQVFDTLALSGALTDAIRITILSSGAVSFYKYSAVVTSGGSIVLNTWNHIAVVRQSQTIKIYLNGTQVNTTYSDTGSNYTCGTNRPLVGINGYDNAANPFQGYIFNLRAVKGTAVYTGNFTPPTGQLATSGAASAAAYPSTTNVDTSFASSACSLLLNFTNAGVVDATAKNVLETVGNAQISTTQSKWGGGSLYFDGTGDYLKAPDDVNWDLGSSNFTIEAWVYPTASPLQPILIGQWTSSYAWLLTLSNDSNRYLRGILYNGSFNDYVSTSPLQLNNWNHCAMVRESNTVSLYLNGSRVYTTTFTGSVSTSTSAVTVGANASGADPFTGYMDDVRITKGLARYTGATYTTPTAPFPVQ